MKDKYGNLPKKELLDEIDVSMYMLKKNYSLLISLYNSFFYEKALWNSDNPKRVVALQGIFLDEYSRMLHTYLGSFASFVDHTLAVINLIGIQKITNEYWKERKKWKTDEVAFVKDLHNFAHHRKLPIPQARFALNIVRDKTSSCIIPKTNNNPEFSIDGWKINGVSRELPD